MALNISNGNMYKFVTHTWNSVKGECFHDCSYCYMKSLTRRKPLKLDESEFNTNMGNGNFIFVGSSNDMFADNIPAEWIQKSLDHCLKFNNRYLFQTKNPKRFAEFDFPDNCFLGITLETNRWIPEIMNNSPRPIDRVIEFSKIDSKKIITIEPIIDFELHEFTEMIIKCSPEYVIFGADSKHHFLPEPSKEKIKQLTGTLKDYTKLIGKDTILRLVG